MQDEDEPRALVRSFSSDLEAHEGPSGNLQRLVKDECAREENVNLRVYFETWKPTDTERKEAFLRSEGKLLYQAWADFQASLPRDRKTAVQRPGPASMIELIGTITEVADRWDEQRRKGKRGAASGYFRGFCQSVDAHSAMLELLPQGNQYISLFTGTLGTMIKASVNYERVTESLSKALYEITDVVDKCHSVCKIFNTERVQTLIAKLYAHIFLFLKDAISWYHKKRWRGVLDSLNENLYDFYADQINTIKKIAAEVKEQAQLGMAAEGRSTRLAMEDSRLQALNTDRAIADVAYFMRKMESRAAREDQEARLLALEEDERMKLLGEYVASRMIDTLEDKARQWLEGRAADTGNRMVQPHQMLMGQPNDPKPVFGRDDFLAASSHLEDAFDRVRINLPFDVGPAIRAPPKVSFCLREWISEPLDQRLLAIAGPRETSGNGLTNITKLAMSFINFANKAGLPTISYFCERKRGIQRPAQQAVTALVYSLIRQLVELLPLKPASSLDLDMSLLSELTGDFDSLNPEALKVLETLLNLAPTLRFVVIDGFEWLDHDSTDKILKAFVKRLRQAPSHIRVLFTTSGRSRALLDVLSHKQYMLADEAGNEGESRRMVLQAP